MKPSSKARIAEKKAAHELLDRVRRGEFVPEWQITGALIMTGDVDENTLPPQQIVVPAGAWERPHAPMMARASWLDPIH